MTRRAPVRAGMLAVFIPALLLATAGAVVAQVGGAGDNPQARHKDAIYRPLRCRIYLCNAVVPRATFRNRMLETVQEDAAMLVVLTELAQGEDATKRAKELFAPWRQNRGLSLSFLGLARPEDAKALAAAKLIEEADAVWIASRDIQRFLALCHGSRLHRALRSMLERDAVLAAGGRAAELFGSRLPGSPKGQTAKALDLLSGFQVDCSSKTGTKKRSSDSGLVGLVLPEGAEVDVRGRRLQSMGSSALSIFLAPSKLRPLRRIILRPGARHDRVALRRAAIERTRPPFPSTKMRTPYVANGTLILVGGGGIPDGILQTIIKEAGGPDAPLVVIPTANGRRSSRRNSVATALLRAGAKDVTILHKPLHSQIDKDFLAALKRAKGIWFGGGRQWRLVDAYADVEAESLMHDVLKRGGVIAGSSAGTSIQAEYMVRGSPLRNTTMMAEGYERGLGFLPGTGVDQHFSQRRRHKDMTSVMKTFPQILGLGIDESTAIIVRKNVMDVVGRGSVAVFDYSKGKPVGDHGKDYVSIKAGERYDLVKRKKLGKSGN